MEVSIFNQLFDQGDFELILQRIFLLLDGASLESCGLVCKQWRHFILRLFQRQGVLRQIQHSWNKGVASSRRIQLGSRFMSVKVDATTIVAGLEDGSVEVWERVGSCHSNGCKLPTMQPFKRLGPLQSKHQDLVRVVDLSPNLIVSGSWDSSIKLWNRHNGNICSSHFSPDGPISGIYLCEAESAYILYSTRSGHVRKLIIDKENLKMCLDEAFEVYHGDCIIDMSVDASRILAGGSDAKLSLWDFVQGGETNLKKMLVGHENGIRCVYLKGSYAMSGSR